jgi:hypothetical protein
VGRSVGLAVGDAEAVGEGVAVGAGGGGVAVAKAITPPTTMAAAPAAATTCPRRERAAPAAATTCPRRDRMNLVRGDVLGVGDMRGILVGGGAVAMGQSAHVPV